MKFSSYYHRWIAANSWSECVGLGGAAVAAWILVKLAPASPTPNMFVFAAFIMIAAGALLEGALVGFVQGRIVEDLLGLSRQAWMKATTLGAAIAWALGMIPSTIMNITHTRGDETIIQPPAWVIYTAAAGMGLVLGSILGFPQAVVLRKRIKGGWSWVVANSVAWAPGMTIIFIGAHHMPHDRGWALTLVMIALTCLASGAFVGAVHGLFLWQLANYHLQGRGCEQQDQRGVE